MKDKGTAVALAFTLGGFGVHRFYLDDVGGGIIYLALTFFTCLLGYPAAWIEGVMLALMSEEAFDQRYNAHRTGTRDITTRVTVRKVVIGPDGQRHEVVEERTTGRDDRVPSGRRPRGRQAEYASRRPRNAAERDRFVLQAAGDNAGMLSPPDLTLMSQFSLAEAREALDALHRQGVCEIEVDDEGLTRYVFPDLRTPDSKARMSGQPLDADEDLHAT